MIESRQPKLEIDLGHNGGHLSFYSREDALAFVDGQLEFWNGLEVPQVGGPVFDQIIGRLNQIEGAVKRQESDTASYWPELAGYLRDAYVDSPVLIHSGTFSAGWLKEIYQMLGREAVRGALGFVLPRLGLDHQQLIRDRSMFAGAVTYQVLASGMADGSVRAAVASLNDAAAKGATEWNTARTNMDGYLSEWTKELELLKAGSEAHQHAQDTERDQRLDDFSQRTDQEITRIQATESLYRTQMELKAPSEYWSKKATEHRDRAKSLRTSVFVAAILGLAIYAGGIWWQFDTIKALLLSFKDDAPALFIVAALVAIAASIPLWFLRILVRFYLSEEHLASDAKERQVMAMTYLALKENGSVADADRAIVLTALFRPGHDGIVKDTGGPDGSLAGLLARLLDK